MLKAYKYRIYPTPDQKVQIDKTIGVCRFIYNLALETKIRVWECSGKSLSAFDLMLQLTQIKKDYPWMREVNSQALESSIKNVDQAFKKFFTGNGFPKFKRKNKAHQSFQCRGNTRKIDFEKSVISIPKIQFIPIVVSRKFEGKIKTITISRTHTGKYFASILVENTALIPVSVISNNAVGIDLGITDFAVLSNGEKIENPRHLKRGLKRLKALQRRASHKKKGSRNRKKANLKVAVLHEKITNQRNDFLHKLSTRLISDNQADTIYIEDLSVNKMIRNHKLAQAINDASWSEFVRQLEYKGKWYGKNVIKIDKWFASSKTCSTCGHKKDELNLSEREWQCSHCGSNHDRDINAAINIRNSGMGSPGASVESSTLVGAKKQKTIPRKMNR